MPIEKLKIRRLVREHDNVRSVGLRLPMPIEKLKIRARSFTLNCVRSCDRQMSSSRSWMLATLVLVVPKPWNVR
eukprot:symbB.v1.2.040508.t1/scaffold7288.1/size12111/1